MMEDEEGVPPYVYRALLQVPRDTSDTIPLAKHNSTDTPIF